MTDAVPTDAPITVRAARRGDEAAILEVLNASFPSWPPCEAPLGQKRYMEWVLDHPDVGRNALPTVALAGDRVVAIDIAVSRPYLLHGREVVGNRTGSFAVHPKFRGRRIASLIEEFEQTHSTRRWGYGWSEAPAMVHLRQRRGGAPAGNRLQVYLRVLDPVAEARSQPGAPLLKAAPYLAYKVAGDVRAARAGRDRGPRDWAVRRVDHFDTRIEELSRAAARDFDLIPLREADDYNWRYADPRGGHFEPFIAEAGEELLGYFVVAVRGQRGHVVDILTRPGRPGLTDSLLRAAVAACRERGAASVECWMMRQHPYAPTLTRTGFIRLRARSDLLAGRFGLRYPLADAAIAELMASPGLRLHVVEGDSNEI